MKAFTLFKRIIWQIVGDKRTVMMVVVAPLIILTIIYAITDNNKNIYDIGIISSPSGFEEKLRNEFKKDYKDITINLKNIDKLSSEDDIKKEIQNSKFLCIINIDNNYDKADIYVNAGEINGGICFGIIKGLIIKEHEELKIKDLNKDLKKLRAIPNINIKEIKTDNLNSDFIKESYFFGKKNDTLFQNFGAALIGIIVFSFVYLIGGINFLGERLSMTLEKLLTTPIRRVEIILGYVLGFSLLAFIQTIVVTYYSMYVLPLNSNGSLSLVILVNLLTAISALTLGLLLSSMAKSEFQFLQFIPIVIFPQIFLCGMFGLSGIWEYISYIVPLKYTVSALKNIITYGNGIEYVYKDIIALSLYSIVFFALNVFYLKKHRKM